jgi:hypothetical protein
VEAPCEHSNEPLGSIKCWEILEYLCNWRLLKKALVPWSGSQWSQKVDFSPSERASVDHWTPKEDLSTLKVKYLSA